MTKGDGGRLALDLRDARAELAALRRERDALEHELEARLLEEAEKLDAARARCEALEAALQAWKWAEANKGQPAGDTANSRLASVEAIRRANGELMSKAQQMRDAALAGEPPATESQT